ncbi:MAG: DUF2911 domain-containing protein [Candidatus Latescibacteria bacterium]|nr:DUF2911 domain-containing protein [Candidatus Latescibacterota bacterium]
MMRRTRRWLGLSTLSCLALFIGLHEVTAQTSAPAQAMASNRGMVEITVKGKKISIDYGRPELKGRDMLGMAPAGFVWRFGMNESTTLKTEASLVFGKAKLPKGSYSAWAKHVEGDKWSLIFNKEVGVWGMPGAKRENDVLEVPFTYTKGNPSVERFIIELKSEGDGGRLTATWGPHKLEATFKTE